MTVSLLKTTVNNVSGNYAPNCLLNGLFEIHIIGDTTIIEPTNLGVGQIFGVKVVGDGTHTVLFDTDFYDADGGVFYGLPPSAGDYYKAVFLYDGDKAMQLVGMYRAF
jgi:hypothetical protein